MLTINNTSKRLQLPDVRGHCLFMTPHVSLVQIVLAGSFQILANTMSSGHTPDHYGRPLSKVVLYLHQDWSLILIIVWIGLPLTSIHALTKIKKKNPWLCQFPQVSCALDLLKPLNRIFYCLNPLPGLTYLKEPLCHSVQWLWAWCALKRSVVLSEGGTIFRSRCRLLYSVFLQGKTFSYPL